MFKMPLCAFTQDETFPFYIQYGEHEEALYMHSHDNFSELVIVLEGSAKHIVDSESYTICKGDVFVIGNETEHGYTDVNNFKICNIMFRNGFINPAELDISESAGFQALFVLEPHFSRNSHFCSRLKLEAENYTDVKNIVQEIYSEYYTHNPGWKTMVKAHFWRLAVTLSRLYSFEALDEKSGVLKLANAVAYIEKNFAESLAVSYLAQLSNYSERQFVRLFKETFGCIPMEYITRLRMQKARELLKMSDLSIAEVASCCGYNDSNYFSRIFKKYNTYTPSEYRGK
jgi:AraC family L-rhamnose operon transcriptional activator RhaR/AraC family L-rhamnose operon regulatory protein RhaS